MVNLAYKNGLIYATDIKGKIFEIPIKTPQDCKINEKIYNKFG